jgi:hypothetical protein
MLQCDKLEIEIVTVQVCHAALLILAFEQGKTL